MMKEKPFNSIEPIDYVDAIAATLGLAIPDEIKPGVVANVEQIWAIAQPVLDFPLPDSLESAATFEP